jgi:hypothetical protein
MSARAEGTLSWGARATTMPATARISVETVAPPRTFSFRWAHPDGVKAREGNFLLVEFTVIPEGEHTRLRMVKTGLVDVEWPAAQAMARAAARWDEPLEAIKHLAESADRDASANAGTEGA